MRLVAVTACPTGVAHTVMAAEALRRQAEVMGHDIEVETQGADGIRHPLPPEAIAGADAVILAADIYVDPARFAGKPLHATSTAEAIRHTASVIEAVLADAAELGAEAGAAATGNGGPAAPGVSPEITAKRLVAVTSCPTGIAHTFMAAEGLRKAAEDLGYWIKVETQGSVGAKNVLTAEEIAAADAVIVAADTKVDLSRFAGKRLHQTGTKDALKHGPDVVQAALSASTSLAPAGGEPAAGPAPRSRASTST